MQFTLGKQVCALFAALLFAGTAAAQQERPNVEYSADQSIETAQFSMSGKLYYAPGKERREMIQSGMRSVNIMRRDKNVMWMLIPETKASMEMAMSGSQNNPGDLSAYKMEFTKLGKETVNGVETSKGKLIVTDLDGRKMRGFMWKTKEGIMVKMDVIATTKGQKMRMKQEITNLKIGKQDPQLFEIPPGYQRGNMAGIAALGYQRRNMAGMLPGGGTPGIARPGVAGAPAVGANEAPKGNTAGAAAEPQPQKPGTLDSILNKLKKILQY